MARLIDRIINEKIYPKEEFLGTLSKIPVIVADQVSEYFYAMTDQEHWDLAEDFHNLAPPFEAFFIEMKRPSMISSRVYGNRDWFAPTPVEAMKASYPLNQIEDYQERCRLDGGKDLNRPRSWGVLFTVHDKKMMLDYPGVSISDIETTKWCISLMFWIEWGKGDVQGPLWHMVFCLDKTGQMVRKNGDSKAAFGVSFPSDWYAINIRKRFPPEEAKRIIESSSREIQSQIEPILLSINFMHCKNVHLKKEFIPPKLAKRSAERGRPLRQYSTIDIEPFRQIFHNGTKLNKEGIKRELKIRRAHFKTYTAERPLLGKAIGTFFWPSWVKDASTRKYSIHSPNNSTENRETRDDLRETILRTE